jgi:hypothetical protein
LEPVEVFFDVFAEVSEFVGFDDVFFYHENRHFFHRIFVVYAWL